MAVESTPVPTPATPAAAQIAAPVVPATTPAPTPAQQPQTVADPPKFVPVPLEEWTSLLKTREDLAKIQAQERDREAKTREDQLTAMAQKGQFENAFKELRDHSQKQLDAERGRLAEIETRAKRYALDGELARALASQPLVPGAPDQLTKLWRGEFVVEPHGDSFKVQSAAGFQSPADFVTAQLARPEYAHFIRAQNPGGGTAGTTGGHQAAPTPAANAALSTEGAPKNLSEAVILAMQGIKKDSADPRLTPGVSFGLRAASRQA